jgi:hypothetical protein
MREVLAAVAAVVSVTSVLAGCGKSQAQGSGAASTSSSEQPSSAPQPAAVVPPPITLSNLNAKVDTAPFGDKAGKPYVDLKLDARVDIKLEKRDVLAARAACEVNGQRFVDESRLFTEGLYKLEAGETKKVSTAFFINNPLDAAPTQCELKFALDRGRGKAVPLAIYCFANGAVTQGGCPAA